MGLPDSLYPGTSFIEASKLLNSDSRSNLIGAVTIRLDCGVMEGDFGPSRSGPAIFQVTDLRTDFRRASPLRNRLSKPPRQIADKNESTVFCPSKRGQDRNPG